MKIAYFDCFSGISGDMIIAALIDAGLPFEYLFEKLKKIKLFSKEKGIKDYFLTRKVFYSHLSATQFITIENKIRIERYKELKAIIDESEFSESIKGRIISVLEKLFSAESKIHGNKVENIHLHELGNIDTLVDICGCLIGIEYFKVGKIYSSPINVGIGFISKENHHKSNGNKINKNSFEKKDSAHPYLPIPAPATIELLKNIPIYSCGERMELTTPTGAAIISTFCDNFGDIPLMRVEKIGYGAGTRESKIPNMLRILIGEECLFSNNKFEKLLHIETNIDDLNPQVYGYLFNRLFALGALDVYLNNIIMKKQRPGINLNVLCKEEKSSEIINAIFNETTTSGIRIKKVERIALNKEIRNVNTKWGVVRVKILKDENKIRNFKPEYDDCEKIASQKGISLISLMKDITLEIEEKINV